MAELNSPASDQTDLTGDILGHLTSQFTSSSRALVADVNPVSQSEDRSCDMVHQQIVSRGNMSSPPGQLITPGQLATSGQLTTPTGQLTMPPGHLTPPPRQLTTPGQLATSGQLTTPTGQLTIPPGHLTTPPGRPTTLASVEVNTTALSTDAANLSISAVPAEILKLAASGDSGVKPDETPATPSCVLCDCIQRGDAQRVSQLIREMSGGDIDPDNSAVYRVIKYYQNYLNSQPNTRNINKCDLWKIPKISQSNKRLELLDTLRVLLKAGLDPNIPTGVETPLMAAVRTHDESFILNLLQHGADPNLSDGREEMNAFALSIVLNDVSVVGHLLHYGADINAACCGSMTPLQLSMNKNVQISKLLLQSGADVQQVLQVTSPHNVQMTGPPLVQAVKSSNVYLASVLLEHGEDVNQTYGDNSENSLHIAVKKEDYMMVKTLVQYGANLNKRTGRGHSPLGLSLLVGGREGSRIARLLLDSGCSRKWETVISLFHRHYAPILVACFRGITDIVDLLLEESHIGIEDSESKNSGTAARSNSEITEKKRKQKSTAHSDCINRSVLEWEASDGSSPLVMAVLGGHYKLVLHLLDLGANPHIICCHGNLAHAAVMSSCPSSMDLLQLSVKLGCNINLINEQRNTPLHLAARTGRSDMYLYLVEQGALLNVKDRFGETALSASVYFGCEDNSRILIQHGADPDLTDTSGTTALYWSIFNNRASTLRQLLSAGARFTPEQLSKYPRNLKVMRNPELLAFIHDQVCQPRSLLSLSVYKVRETIRHLSRGRSIKEHIHRLPVPVKVKDRLLLLSHVV